MSHDSFALMCHAVLSILFIIATALAVAKESQVLGKCMLLFIGISVWLAFVMIPLFYVPVIVAFGWSFFHRPQPTNERQSKSTWMLVVLCIGFVVLVSLLVFVAQMQSIPWSKNGAASCGFFLAHGVPTCYRPNCDRIFGRIVTVETLRFFTGFGRIDDREFLFFPPNLARVLRHPVQISQSR